MRRGLVIGLFVVGTLGAVVPAAPAAAQRFPAEALDSIATDTLRGPSPGGAFFRSVIVPGWGQASAGSYTRGAVWFAIQSTSWYMLLKTIGQLSEIEGIERRRVATATDSLNQLIATDPEKADELEDPIAFENAVAADPRVAAARDLIEARRQHRQDWIVYTMFFTLMSGVDALVTAHLRGFPEVLLEPRTGGGMNFGVSLPVGRP